MQLNPHQPRNLSSNLEPGLPLLIGMSTGGRSLDAAYEATLWAAVLNCRQGGSNIVLLTMLGGGAFGNATEWIHTAIERALKKAQGHGLDVRLVSYGPPSVLMRSLVSVEAGVR